MAELADRLTAVHVDLGTGDGAFVRRIASSHPNRLVIGLDANADGLRAASRRSRAKPARGGLTNALFGRLSIEDAPGALAGIADAVTVLLPWGGLLRAVALPDPDDLQRMRALCKPDAQLRVVVGYGPTADDRAIREFDLPRLDDPSLAPTLVHRYHDAGFVATVAPIPVHGVRALPTTWAKKLAFSGRERRFIEVQGQATHAARGTAV